MTVLVLLSGLTADGKVYAQGQREDNPGPELLNYTKPGVVHWLSKKRAARILEERDLESVSDSDMADLENLEVPPGAVVVLMDGLTADSRVYNRLQVVLNAGPELSKFAEPGNLHWTGKQAAIRRPELVPEPPSAEEKAAERAKKASDKARKAEEEAARAAEKAAKEAREAEEEAAKEKLALEALEAAKASEQLSLDQSAPANTESKDNF